MCAESSQPRKLTPRPLPALRSRRLSRLRSTVSAPKLPLLVHPVNSASPPGALGPSLAGSGDPSPSRRSDSLARELFTAQADVVTVQAQVDGLHGALQKVSEHLAISRGRAGRGASRAAPSAAGGSSSQPRLGRRAALRCCPAPLCLVLTPAAPSPLAPRRSARR